MKILDCVREKFQEKESQREEEKERNREIWKEKKLLSEKLGKKLEWESFLDELKSGVL